MNLVVRFWKWVKCVCKVFDWICVCLFVCVIMSVEFLSRLILCMFNVVVICSVWIVVSYFVLLLVFCFILVLIWVILCIMIVIFIVFGLG